MRDALGASLPAGQRRAGRPLRRDRRRRRDRAAGLLEGGAGPRPADDRLSERIGNLIGLAAFIALPSVVLMMMFGQTRIFFVMARDGLLPEKLASVHPRFRTPHVVTVVTGVGVTLAAAFLPVGKLADYSNSGTLFAFTMVAISVMVLAPQGSRAASGRSGRPLIGIVAPLAIIGCIALYVDPAADRDRWSFRSGARSGC